MAPLSPDSWRSLSESGIGGGLGVRGRWFLVIHFLDLKLIARASHMNSIFSFRQFPAQVTSLERPLLLLCLLVTLSPTAVGQQYDEAPAELRVMTWNVEWMFDDYRGDNRSDLAKEQSAPTRDYWNSKLAGVAEVIAAARPGIVALQEIEGDQTLRDIANKIKAESNLSYRYAFIQGTDSFTEQDVGILMRGGLTAYRRHEQSKTMFDSNEYYNLSKHIACEFRWRDVASPLTIMNVHLRARAQAEDLRVRQLRLARVWLESALQDGQDVVLMGDLNTEHLVDDLSGDIAEIAGADGRPRMIDLLTRSAKPTDPTHLILDRQYDRIFVSESLLEDGPGKDWVFDSIEVITEGVIRGTRDGQTHWDERLTLAPEELDLSDHFPVVATFQLK